MKYILAIPVVALFSFSAFGGVHKCQFPAEKPQIHTEHDISKSEIRITDLESGDVQTVSELRVSRFGTFFAFFNADKTFDILYSDAKGAYFDNVNGKCETNLWLDGFEIGK